MPPSETPKLVMEASSTAESRLALPSSTSSSSFNADKERHTESSSKADVDDDASALPEGFFDDPVADAKVKT